LNHFEIKLKHSEWICSSGATVKGAAFAGKNFNSRVKLSEFFNLAKEPDEFIACIKKLNGFFAVICQRGTKLFAMVDRVRSVPLFYGEKDKVLYLSDDAEWVRKKMEDWEQEKIAEIEFLLTGYVTGCDTLYPNVKQLQAGEALIAEQSGEDLVLHTRRYYSFVSGLKFSDDQDGLIEEYDRVITRCMERLIEWADGRTIVVPLSGGYDSRLIALMIKRLGYENVISFTYGQPGNLESKISREIADQLGFQWEFVPYSNELWRKWFYSPEREAYYRMAHNCASLPHIQDWPAIWDLKIKGKLPDNSIFVPGHNGGFLAGGDIPSSFIKRKSVDNALLVKEIINDHYRLWNPKQFMDRLESHLQKKIWEAATSDMTNGKSTCLSLYEKWYWQERQAKFLLNSVRVYEFWGYKWWVPILDSESLEFWSRVPVKFRLDKKLYKDYISRLYSQVLKGNRAIALRTDQEMFAYKVWYYLQNTFFWKFIKPIYHWFKRFREYKNHPLAWYGWIDKKEFHKEYTGRQTINSFLSKEILKKETPTITMPYKI